MTFNPNTHLIKLFIRWIEQFDNQHARNWAKLYKNDPEAAMCEATFWGALTDCGVQLKPNADLSGEKRQPDLLCRQDGQEFYVEVTCIPIEKATRQTGLEHEIKLGANAQFYSLLNRAIFNKCIKKAQQCSEKDAPCLLAIGTFHGRASASCMRKEYLQDLLTGDPCLTMDFDPVEGKTVGEPYQTTKQKSSSFVRPSGKSVFEYARESISGLLLGGFGCAPPRMYGILHPNPARGFDPGLLPRIPFCELHFDLPRASFFVEWSQEAEIM